MGMHADDLLNQQNAARAGKTLSRLSLRRKTPVGRSAARERSADPASKMFRHDRRSRPFKR